MGAQHRLGFPKRPKRPSSWNISRTLGPFLAWRTTSRCTRARSFFKGVLRLHVRLWVTWSGYDFAPAMAVQHSIDGRAGHRIAHLLLQGLLDLAHMEQSAGLCLDRERGQ